MQKCYICKTKAGQPIFRKSGLPYWKCEKCEAVYCKVIPNRLLVTENDTPEKRSMDEANSERLKRVETALDSAPKKIVDFGCGTGHLSRFLESKNILVTGIDQNTKTQLRNLSSNSYDAIMMVEVIEHLYKPIVTFKKMAKALRTGGVIYIETSFVDFIPDYVESDYIDPKIGHSSIQSKKSVEMIAENTGFETKWVNNNVVLFRKKFVPPGVLEELYQRYRRGISRRLTGILNKVKVRLKSEKVTEQENKNLRI